MAKTIWNEMYKISEAIDTAAAFANGGTRYNEHIPTSKGETANALMANALWACGLIDKEGNYYVITHEARQKAEKAYRELGCRYHKFYQSESSHTPRMRMSTIVKIWGGAPELRA